MNTPAAQSDPLDAALLDAVQRCVPLTPQPFAALAQQVGIREADCLARLRRLKNEQRVIRQISAIFDTHALGYRSSLVACRIPPAHLETAAGIIGAHPGVSHNYERQHAFNLWYTVAVPPDSKLGLEGTVQRLHELSGADSSRLLPTLKLFKIGVRLNVADDDALGKDDTPAGFTESDRAIASQYTLDDADRRMVAVLQQDLPLVEQPYADWAQQAGVSVTELLTAAERFLARKQMRRFSAVLRHRSAGMNANVMGVWAIDPDDAVRVGEALAQFRCVSHCYLRPTYSDWPFNIFTMIHARTRDEADRLLAELAAAARPRQQAALWSLREFKKVRVRYFTNETAQWEQQHAPAGCATMKPATELTAGTRSDPESQS